MPTYVYGCNKCEHQFEKVELIANRHNPTKEPCPACKEEGHMELVPSMAAIGDPHKLGVTRLPGWWTDKLKSIKSKHRGSTIKTDSSLSR